MMASLSPQFFKSYLLTDSLLLARLGKRPQGDIGLLALSDEAVGHHPNNIEVLPIICFRGHGQSSHTIEIIF